MLPSGDSSEPPPPPPPAERAVDLLVDLPADALDKILAGLPCSDLVRTSVLSRPWRHRWESVPGIDINLHNLRDSAATWASAARFLERCAAPVGRVSILGVPLSACRRADDWVRAVADKSPRALSLLLPAGAAGVGRPLRSLFHFADPAAMAELELRRVPIPPQPAGFAGFRRLTKLDLENVFFTGRNAWEQIEGMVEAAGATLVELRLQNVVFPVACKTCRAQMAGWEIRAPNLRRLVLRLKVASAGLWELGPLPKLEVARIYLSDSAEERDYVKMFTAISNVGELHLGNFRMATQEDAIDIFEDQLWRFRNLRILRLDGCFHEYPANHLFNLSPFLETIEIKRWY